MKIYRNTHFRYLSYLRSSLLFKSLKKSLILKLTNHFEYILNFKSIQFLMIAMVASMGNIDKGN